MQVANFSIQGIRETRHRGIRATGQPLYDCDGPSSKIGLKDDLFAHKKINLSVLSDAFMFFGKGLGRFHLEI